VSDSLVIADKIELIGPDGGVASTIPACAGAVFTLGTDYDLSAPQTVADIMTASLLDGERPSRRRVSNRVFTIPVKIEAPDRQTLTAAREVLLELLDADNWTLTWTTDGGSPVVFDCFQALAAQPANQLFEEQELVSRITVQFPALPFGRSDELIPVLFNCPSQVWELPPSPVNVDIFGTSSNWLTGDDTGFEASAGAWVTGGNSSVSRTTAQAHTGAGSLLVSSSASGAMQAMWQASANYALMVPVVAGDTVTARGWWRAQASARSANMGVDFYDGTGTQVGSTLRGSNITDSTSAWTQATAAVTAPAGAVWARPNGQVLATGAANEQHYLDDVWIDRGAAQSWNDGGQWSLSNVVPIAGQHSAKWSRTWHDSPVYDHTLAATVNLTGLTKLTFWAGFMTTSSQWATWHKGTITYAVTLYDGAGNTLAFSHKQSASASMIDGSPHWQFISVPIPQQTSGFDYTTVSRYAINAYNVWQTNYGPVLQAGMYLAAVVATASATGSPVARGAWYTIPAPVGSARAPIAYQAAPGPSSYSTITEFTTPGSNNWTAPAGLTTIDKTEGWAGGGGGAGSYATTAGGGGGGGGEYSRRDKIPVTALGTYHPFVGAGGTHGGISANGSPGQDSYFTGDSSVGIRAHAGQGGSQNPSGGGAPGSGSSDPIHYGGGWGFQTRPTGRDIGGGGGGSGGSSGGGQAPGGNGRPGAVAVTDGGPGGNGGYSDVSQSQHAGLTPASGPGGGGGGGAFIAPGQIGGDGAAGKIRLTYGATGLLPLNSLLLHMPGRDAPPALNPLCPVGNGADTPNGATEYTVPAIGSLAARFDGTYTCYLIASSWASPSSSRLLPITLKQYPYTGGTAVSLPLTRTVTPSTDITNGYVEMGPVTLPLAELPPGQLQAYFTVAVTSGNTSDRFLDVLFLDVTGQTLLVNVAGTSLLNNIWADAPDANRALGGIYGSNADRDQSWSITANIDRMSGGAFSVEPTQHNRLLTYSQQGAPAVTGQYLPHWWMDRADVTIGSES